MTMVNSGLKGLIPILIMYFYFKLKMMVAIENKAFLSLFQDITHVTLHELQCFGSNSIIMIIFYPSEVVGCSRKTQLQVGNILIK